MIAFLSGTWSADLDRLARVRGDLGAMRNPHIVDFCDEDVRVVIEVDGSSHDGRSELDARRESELRKRGYEVVRCTNSEVLQQPDAVLLRVVYARVATTKARQSA